MDLRRHATDTPPLAADQARGIALRPQGGGAAVHSSARLGWRSVYAVVSRRTGADIDGAGLDCLCLAYRLDRSLRVTRDRGGERAEDVVRPRQLTLLVPGQEGRWTHGADADIAHVRLAPSLVARHATEARGVDPGRVGISPFFAVHDPLLEQLALNVLRAMQEHPPGHALYVDCLAQAMAAHLVQHHSTLSRPARAPKPDGLVDWRLRRLVDRIEASLAGDLTLGDLAEAAGLSPVHLARAFKRTFGTTPHRYVLGRRIERAKELLVTTDLPLAEVALACGFAGQSHLTSWFGRIVGTTPARFRAGR